MKKTVASASVLWGCSASNTYFRSWEPLSSGRPDPVICKASSSVTAWQRFKHQDVLLTRDSRFRNKPECLRIRL